MTGAANAVISTVNKELNGMVPITSHCINIIGFLTRNGIETWEIPTKDYEILLGMDHLKPIIIEYMVEKHKYEAKNVPYHWTIFCLLFRKKLLFLPFNDTSAGLVLGSAFMNQDWKRENDFERYCKANLHNKICPVVDNRIRKTKSKCTCRLTYINAWTITTPIGVRPIED